MSEYSQFWDNETDIADLGIEQPDWISQTLSPYDMISIYEGGCASGAYMPAVTYYQAEKTMHNDGDDVLDYIQESYGEVPAPPTDGTWAGMAVFFLSLAVELWVAANMDNVAEALEQLDAA